MILCIIKEDKRVIAFDKSYMSFSDLISSIKPNDNYYIIANINNTLYSADLINIVNRCTRDVNTWDLFETYLTSGILFGSEKLSPRIKYVWTKQDNKAVAVNPPVEVSTHPIYRTINSVIVYPFDLYNDILADFGTRNNPSLRNITGLKSMLNDIIFRKNVDNTINFNNTIPIINSMVCFPIVYEEELYTPNSTGYLPIEDNKNILLLDFSPIGNIETIRLKDCVKNTSPISSRLEILLPSNVTTANKSVILVLAGKMFFPNEIYIPSNRLITISLRRYNLNNILISNRIKIKDYDSVYTMTHVDTDYYVNNQIWNVDDYNNFIIIIDNPEVKTLEYPVGESFETVIPNKGNNLFMIDKNESKQGFVMRVDNRDIIDYTWLSKRARNLLMFSATDNLIFPDGDIGYIEPSPVKTYGKRIVDSKLLYKNIFSVAT